MLLSLSALVVADSASAMTNDEELSGVSAGFGVSVLHTQESILMDEDFA